MNTFALKLVQEFPAVAYYTVVLNDATASEFDQFWAKHKGAIPPLQRDFHRTVGQLEFMGEHIASTDLLRWEGECGGCAWAIPQQRSRFDSGWRLYCMHVTDFCIILFNGGVKTHQRPHKCPHVRAHFYCANALTIAIAKAIEEGKIVVKDDRLILSPIQQFQFISLP